MVRQVDKENSINFASPHLNNEIFADLRVIDSPKSDIKNVYFQL